MSDRVRVLLVMIVLTGLALVATAGHQSWAGPALWKVGGTHGVALGDVAVVGGWALGAVCCWRWWRGRDE